MKPATRIRLRPIYPVAVALLLAEGCSEEAPLDPASLAVAPATNLTATAVDYQRIYVTWIANARNASGWEVHRSTTGSNGTFALLRTLFIGSASEITDDGLQALTEYCYKARSFRTAGPRKTFGDFSNVGCATTPAIPLPPTPTLSGRPICCHAISLTWNDASGLETGFRIERAAVSNGPWALLINLSANWTSWSAFVATELPVCHRIIAVSGLGESAPSNVVCSAVPEAPTNLAAVVTGRDVNLTWTDNSGLEGGYAVQRVISGTGQLTVVATLPPNTTAYRDVNPPDNNYLYQVYAIKDGGNSGNSNQVQVVIASTPPAAPTGLSVMPENSTTILATWVDASNNESGFQLQRSTNGGATWTPAGQGLMNSSYLWDPARSPEAQVCYRVMAFNNAGESAPSNSDCTAPPASPTELTATGIDAQTIDLVWRDNSAVEDGYEVQAEYCYYYYYYYYSPYCYWSAIASLGPNTTTHRLTDPSYYFYNYAVLARKDGGQSTWSNIAVPTPPPGTTAGMRRR